MMIANLFEVRLTAPGNYDVLEKKNATASHYVGSIQSKLNNAKKVYWVLTLNDSKITLSTLKAAKEHLAQVAECRIDTNGADVDNLKATIATLKEDKAAGMRLNYDLAGELELAKAEIDELKKSEAFLKDTCSSVSRAAKKVSEERRDLEEEVKVQANTVKNLQTDLGWANNKIAAQAARLENLKNEAASLKESLKESWGAMRTFANTTSADYHKAQSEIKGLIKALELRRAQVTDLYKEIENLKAQSGSVMVEFMRESKDERKLLAKTNDRLKASLEWTNGKIKEQEADIIRLKEELAAAKEDNRLAKEAYEAGLKKLKATTNAPVWFSSDANTHKEARYRMKGKEEFGYITKGKVHGLYMVILTHVKDGRLSKEIVACKETLEDAKRAFEDALSELSVPGKVFEWVSSTSNVLKIERHRIRGKESRGYVAKSGKMGKWGAVLTTHKDGLVLRTLMSVHDTLEDAKRAFEQLLVK